MVSLYRHEILAANSKIRLLDVSSKYFSANHTPIQSIYTYFEMKGKQ